MNKTLPALLIGLTLIAGAVAAGNPFGMDRPDAGRPIAGHPIAGHPDAGRPDAGRPLMGRPYDRGFGLLAFMADALELTDEQEEGINQLLDSARLDSAVDRERMAQLREQMRDLSRDANAFDEPAAELLAMELAEIVSRMAVNGAQLRWQVRQLLTQEQLAQLENMPGLRGDRYTMSGNAEF